MSAERKKLLWIAISVCVVLLIVLGFGIFLLSPKKGGAQAPATIGNTAPPKAQDPQDFLSAPPPAPTLEQPRNPDGGMIIVYGDKPSLPTTTKSANAIPSSAPASPATASAAPTAVPASPAATSAGLPAAVSKAPPAAMAAVPAKASAAKPPALPKGQQPSQKSVQKSATAKIDEFWIQAASFTSRGRADELKQGLADKGIAALISVKDISGKSWYRVRIGPYSVKADAEGWLGKLKDIPGCTEAYVSRLSAAVQKAK